MNMRRPKLTTTPERLTWEDICVRYPDQWVVLVDIDWLDEEGEFRTAVVIAHGQGRDETLLRSDPLKAGYRDVAHRYTGRVRTPFISVNLPLWR